MKKSFLFLLLSLISIRFELITKMSFPQIKVIAKHLGIGFFSDLYTIVLILSLSSLFAFIKKKYFRRSYVFFSFVIWGFALSNALYYKFFGSHLSWWIIEKHYSDASWIADTALSLSLSIPLAASVLFLVLSYFFIFKVKEEKRVFDLRKKTFQLKFLIIFILLAVAFLLLRQSPKWFNYKEKHTAFNSQLFNIWIAEAKKDSYVRRKNDVLISFKSKKEIQEAVLRFKDTKNNFREKIKTLEKESITAQTLIDPQDPQENPHGITPSRLALGYGKTVPINIIWVILESVRTYEFDHPEIGELVFPGLKSLLKTNGVYFKNFYTSSFGAGMSARGQFSMLCSSYPKMLGPGTYMMMGTLNFPCLTSILSDKKINSPYQTLSFMGFQSDFHNQKFFESYQGMKTFYDLNYFSKQGFNKFYGHWGLADEIIFEEGFKKLVEHTNLKKPIFARFSTASTHVPQVWIPEAGLSESLIDKYKETPEYINYLSSLKYVDSHLSQFIKEIFNEPKLQNTVIMVTGDHGLKEYLPDEMDLKQIQEIRFRVPTMIFSKTLEEGRVSERLSHHMDFSVTSYELAGITNISPRHDDMISKKWLGRSLFSHESTPWIYRNSNELIYRTDKHACYQPISSLPVECYEPTTDFLYGDFLIDKPENKKLTEYIYNLSEAVEALISLNKL
jgi:phosphoglycerol transferase MdoB-like AlkP superfamily enzyme